MQKAELGYLGEKYVAQYLEGKGYALMDRNYRKPWGEVDLIVKKDGVLVFVEVKASRAYRAGFEPEVRANPEKMAKVHRTARTYLAQMRYPEDQEWQIDIISITFDTINKSAQIRHFKNIEL